MRYARLELNGRYQEIGPQAGGPLGTTGRAGFRFDRFYEQVERILASRAVVRVLVHRREGFAVPAFGGLEEVRAALLRLSEAGRDVHYYAAEYHAVDCVLASACAKRVLHPLGQVSFRGLARSSLFFRRLLDEQGVGVTVIRRDRYKSAADPVRTDAYDAHARRQLQALIDGAVEAMREAATAVRGGRTAPSFTPEGLDAMLSGRVFTAPEALEAGMVDELRTVDDLTNEWKAQGAKDGTVRRLRGRFGSGPRVAVLVFEGAIIEGPNRRHPLLGQAIGDRAMVKTIRALRENRRVRAVVFRINSGGGSAVASENIVRELMALHAQKPLVVSMGPVAGSGGYWISTTGRRLFALPTTVTGSIGVFTLFFDLSKLLERNGITVDHVKRGAYADLGSALRPLTDDERATVDGVVEFLYQQFVDRVATVRRKEPAEVREIAEGRVWLGRDAHQNGLVDELGGLPDAIAHARRLLGAKRVRVTFEPRVSRLALLLGRRGAADGLAWNADEPPSLLGHGSLGVDAAMAAAPLAGAAGRTGLAAALALVDSCLAFHARPLFLDPDLVGLTFGDPPP